MRDPWDKGSTLSSCKRVFQLTNQSRSGEHHYFHMFLSWTKKLKKKAAPREVYKVNFQQLGDEPGKMHAHTKPFGSTCRGMMGDEKSIWIHPLENKKMDFCRG